MASTGKLLTYERAVAELPESNQPQEISDGQLVMAPAPFFAHQQVVFRVHKAFDLWVAERKLGWVASSPIDMVLSPHRTVQPDVVFVCTERRSIIQGAIHGPADLVVEVISPGSREIDRISKQDLYALHGIKEYWLVDPESKSIEVLWLDPFRYEVTARYKPGDLALSKILPGLQIEVSKIFEDLLD